jgi:hypothetical protein
MYGRSAQSTRVGCQDKLLESALGRRSEISETNPAPARFCPCDHEFNQSPLDAMKTYPIKTDGLILALGIALVAAGLWAAANYRHFERETQSAQATIAACLRLNQDLQFSAALRAIHDGEANRAARMLDLRLCEDIVAVHGQLASADSGNRALIENAFARLSLVRPPSAQLSADAGRPLRPDQIEAEHILAQAHGETLHARGVVAASP